MSLFFGWSLIGLLALLAAVECRRFVRAAGSADAIPYPRARLVRRLIVALLFAGTLALLCYWPARGRNAQILCLCIVMLAMVSGLGLLWRDLHETSVEVVAHSQRMNREAGESLKSWLERQRAAEQSSERTPRKE